MQLKLANDRDNDGRYHLPLLLLFALVLSTSCVQRQSLADVEAPATVDPGTNPTAQPSPTPSGTQQPQRVVTFYQDILPLLKLNEPRRQYECLQCHSAYAQPEKVAKARVVDDIIKSVESGFMPMNEGDRMWPQDIELLKLWRRSGLQIGTPPQATPQTAAGATSP